MLRSADSSAESNALKHKDVSMSYAGLATAVMDFAALLLELKLPKHGRVALFLCKQSETVIGTFGTCKFGGAFVPINPIFRPLQVACILGNCEG